MSNACVDITSNYNTVFPWIAGFDTTSGVITVQKSDLLALGSIEETHNLEVHMSAWLDATFFDFSSCSGSSFTYGAPSDGSAELTNHPLDIGWNDRVSSVWLASYHQVTLHLDLTGGGSAMHISGDDNCHDLGSFNN